jgi:predicted Zn-dependent protease
MKRRCPKVLRSLLPIALAVTGLWSTGCALTTEPETGRRQFIITSPEMETNLGAEAWQDVRAKSDPSTNRVHIEAVQRVGANIKEVVSQYGFDWEFVALASDEANAFCLPGGKVAVYDGIFKAIGNDAELAAVVSHEIAHATARHGAERMSQAMAVQALGVGAALALGSMDVPAADREKWLLAYTGLSTVGVILPFSRVHESAADEIGLLYMARAGYDPQAAVSFWQKFADAKEGPGTPEFLSTHPSDATRIEDLQEKMPKAMQEYRAAPVKRGLGMVYPK